MSEIIRNLVDGVFLLGTPGNTPKYPALYESNFLKAKKSLNHNWKVYNRALSAATRKVLNGTKETRR